MKHREKRKPPSETVKRLRRENRRLKAENKRLHRTVAELRQKSPSALADLKGKYTESFKESEEAARFSVRSKETAFYRQRSFPRYLAALIRTSALYGIWKQIYTLFRRYRLTVLILQIVLFLLTVLQSGAVFWVVSAFSAALLPAFFTAILLFSQIISFRKRREKRLLAAAVHESQSIYVFHCSKKAFPCDKAFSELISAQMLRENALVLIISPFLVSARGPFASRQPYYAASREEAPHIFLLRAYFYFGIRKNLRENFGERAVVFY